MSNDEVFHLRSRVANLDREIKDYQERESASSREFEELRSRLGVVETEHDNLRKAVHNERSGWEEERRDLQLRASSSGSQHLEELVAVRFFFAQDCIFIFFSPALTPSPFYFIFFLSHLC